MPNLNEFFNKTNDEKILINDRVETIDQPRPCSKCDLDVESYQFNNELMEMYWKCSNGHETRHSVG